MCVHFFFYFGVSFSTFYVWEFLDFNLNFFVVVPVVGGSAVYFGHNFCRLVGVAAVA